MRDTYANVVLNAPGVDHSIYTYKVPLSLQGQIDIGKRVKLPFAHRYLEGYIIAITNTPDFTPEKIKDIDSLLDDQSYFDKKEVDLLLWIQKTYHCTYGDALRCLLPPGVKREEEAILELSWSDEQFFKNQHALSSEEREIMQILLQEGGNKLLSDFTSKITADKILEKLRKKGALRVKKVLTNDRVGPKYQKEVYLAVSGEDVENYIKSNCRATRQKEILNFLVGQGKRVLWEELRTRFPNADGSFRILQHKGLIRIEQKECTRTSFAVFSSYPKPLSLTEDQQKAIDLIFPALFKGEGKFLLHGITGSGKTEVYLHLIEKTCELGKGSLVLVPEIALTPQMVERFVGRFGGRVAVLHSGLSSGERFDQWRRVRNGEADIVVGARSAIFAPIRNIGLIIIDEEHENSYKQDRIPYYETQEVAYQRAALHRGVVVLGSATPSIDTYFRAHTGEITLVEMNRRVDGLALPSVTLVDMREEIKNNNRSIFCRILQEKIYERLEKKEQIILFLNRRGYTNFVLCRSCGTVVKCPHCDVSLTYHTEINRLLCHYCGYAQNLQHHCPVCHSTYFRHFGVGTQKVEAEVKRLFPMAKVIRMDVDSMRKKGAYEESLRQFKNGNVDILIGTQIVSKGHDFPNVTLVGVVNADTTINLPDYRAGERTFQILTQVAGRAGRGSKGGEVIVQTYYPEHYSLIAASRHSYKDFYSQEISIRKELFYPPFSSIVRVLLSGREEKQVMCSAQSLMNKVREYFSQFTKEELQHFGPAPAPIQKINNYFRWQFFLKIKKDVAVKEILDIIEKKFNELSGTRAVRLNWELNPNSLL